MSGVDLQLSAVEIVLKCFVLSAVLQQRSITT